jgi:putative Holliday junction resolvase
MGLDVGTKRIGVALSDPCGWIAQGLEIVRRGGTPGAEMDRLKEIAASYGVEQVIIGLPRNMDGSLGPQAEVIRVFADELAAALNLPVEFWDERLTTVAAEKLLLQADLSRSRRRRVIDKIAAAIMLQNYLDYKMEINSLRKR